MGRKIKFKNVLLAFIFLYPISPWYITFGPLNLVNIISILFLICWCLMCEMRISNFKNTCIWFWIYLSAYSIQAILDTSLMRSMAYIIAQFVVCVVVYSEVKKRQLFNEALDMLVYAAGFLCVTGLFEEISRINIFHLISGLPNSAFYIEIRLGIYRIETLFSHPIVYCGYLCIISGILVYLINKETNKKKLNIYRCIYCLVLINALLTMSRSTLFVLICEQAILGYMTGVIRFGKKLLTILILAVLGFIIADVMELSFISKLKDIWFMFLSLFDDQYTSLYSTSFGFNQSGVGDRLDLYSWVTETVKGHELFGMGTSAEFDYTVHAMDKTWFNAFTYSKTSIENEYLYNYFIHGLVGLTFFILNIIGCILYTIKTILVRKRIRYSDEKRVTFPAMMLVLVIGYAIMLFFVRSSDNVRIFNVLMCLLFVYYHDIRRSYISDIMP